MIQKIRRRFIRMALAVLAGAMILVTLIINMANLANVNAELRETLAYLVALCQNDQPTGKGMRGGHYRRMQNALSESRYFTVLVSPGGKVTLEDMTHDPDNSAADLADVAYRALLGGRGLGYCQDYIFARGETKNGAEMAIFLNTETKLGAVRRLALLSAAACLGGILLAWLLVCLFSSRASRPLIQSTQRQKQFITDAGHELKTPLTVISANMDVLRQDLGENEWVNSTRRQTAAMGELVSQLVYLSRMDEEEAKLIKADFDLAAALRETTASFVGMAEFYGKRFRVDAPAHLSMTGDEAAMRRLMTILCDNAVKYAPQGDDIVLSCRVAGKKIILETENGTREKLTQENLKRLFDRFYRVDSSRAKESGGGTGIGLAIARAIAEKHGGSVRAQLVGEARIKISCVCGVTSE